MRKLFCLFILSVAVLGCGRDSGPDENTSEAVDETNPRPDVVKRGLGVLKEQGGELIDTGSTTSGAGVRNTASGQGLIDRSLLPLGPESKALTFDNVLFSTFWISGLSFVAAQMIWRHRQKMPLKTWEVIKSGAIGFGAAGLCASALAYLKFRATSPEDQPVPAYIYQPPASVKVADPSRPGAYLEYERRKEKARLADR